MSQRTKCIHCGRWIAFDPYGPGWYHVRPQGLFCDESNRSGTYASTIYAEAGWEENRLKAEQALSRIEAALQQARDAKQQAYEDGLVDGDKNAQATIAELHRNAKQDATIIEQARTEMKRRMAASAERTQMDGATIERLRAALQRYGHHSTRCEALTIYMSNPAMIGGCTCGFADVLHFATALNEGSPE